MRKILALKKDSIITFIVHPAFIGFILFILSLIIFTPGIDPYTFELISSGEHSNKNELKIYCDLNSDGSKEFIKAYNLRNKAALIAYQKERVIFEVWSLPGFWMEKPEICFHDSNSDSIKEAYGITLSPGDSLFLTKVKLMKGSNDKKSYFICKAPRLNKKPDISCHFIGLADINADLRKEIIFYVNAGFSLQPRGIYAFDITEEKFYKSPFSGTSFSSNVHLIHENIDVHPAEECFSSMLAIDNYSEFVPYSDTASYAMVFTKNLNYLFPPVYCGGAQSKTTCFPIKFNGSSQILAITFDRREEQRNLSLRLINQNGNVLKKKICENFIERFQAFYSEGKIYILTGNTEKTWIAHPDSDLRFIPEWEFNGKLSFLQSIDLDETPGEEHIFINRSENTISILNDETGAYNSIHIPGLSNTIYSISLKSVLSGESQFLIGTDNKYYEFSYKKNGFYPFRHLIILCIYFGITLFLTLLQKIFIYRNQRKEKLEKRILDYQFQSVMNQLNPHFTFNAINSIGDAVLEGRNLEAYEYFTKLSNLIRETMKNAFQPLKTLGEELDFVKEYLEIEEYRFENKLKWTIHTDPKIDTSIKIPKMLIHIFVENIIKHGVFQEKGKGEISIVLISCEKKQIIIKIRDNGIGLKKSMNIHHQKGKGLEIMDNYLALYNRVDKHKIEYKKFDISELKPQETGTLIEIYIS